MPEHITDQAADAEQPSDGTSLELAVSDKAAILFRQSLSQAQVDFLLQRTPQAEVKTRQGRGGLMLSYVEHGYVTERLNMVFGFNWDFEIMDKQVLEDEVVVQAKLTVRTPTGQTIVKTQFGGADIKRLASGEKRGRPLSIADDYKAAGSDALKKCASLLGIGLDLYGRDRPYDVQDDEPPVKPSVGSKGAPKPANGVVVDAVDTAGPGDSVFQFRVKWKQLRSYGWTDPQITAQYEQVAGRDQFEALNDALRALVLAKLDSMIEVEKRNGRAAATRDAKAAEGR